MHNTPESFTRNQHNSCSTLATFLTNNISSSHAILYTALPHPDSLSYQQGERDTFITVERLKDVSHRRTFKDLMCGTFFVGSFRGQFGIWHKAGEEDIVGLSEDGRMTVQHPKNKYEPYESVFKYTKVELRVSVEVMPASLRKRDRLRLRNPSHFASP